MALYGGITLPGQPDYGNIRKLDQLPVRCIMEMMHRGFAIDKEYLHDISSYLGSCMSEMRKDICSYIPPDKLDEFVGKDDDGMNVDSNQQLGDLLFDILKIGDGRELKRTKSGDRLSTGKKQLEVLKREHPVIPKILIYREHAKLKSTYADSLPNKSVWHPQGLCWCGERHIAGTWRIDTTILGTRTTTGRYASKSPNLQNISTRTELGRLIRAAFIATHGMVLVGCDWSQQEMRLGGHYSQDRNLLRIFREGLDPHNDTAKRAFKTDNPDKMTQRDPCKNVNFGVFYGLSGSGLFDLMAITYATAGIPMPDWLTVSWCEDFIEQWFKLYPGVRDYLNEQEYRAFRYGMVWTLFGRVREVPEAKSCHKRIVASGIRQAGNLPIQGSCADLMRLVLPEVHDFILGQMRPVGVRVWPLITVHDEGIWEVEEDYAESFKGYVQDTFGSVLVDKDSGVSLCRVPIKADAKIMDRWQK